MGIIHIEGIKIYAFHGVLAQENKIGTYYNIDLKIQTDLSKAKISDDLLHTINYSLVNDVVHDTMQIPVKLLEHLTHKINMALIEKFPNIKHIETKLTKKSPPMYMGEVDQVSVILQQEN